jgi:hypothetical protein
MVCSHWRWWNLFVDLGDDTRLVTDCAADHSAQTSNTAAEVRKTKNHVFLEFCWFGSTNSPEFLNEA